MIDYTSKTVEVNGTALDLTKLEYSIVEFLSMNPGMVFDKERIYEKICGYDGEGDSRVVTELIRRIRKRSARLGHTETEYIETVWGMGVPVGKIRNLSLRKTIILYMCVALVCSFFLAALTAWAAERIQDRIWWKYTDQGQYFEAQEMEDEGFWVQIPRPNAYEMSEWDYNISELCDFLQTYSVLVLSVAGSCLAVFLFYRNKLRTPIRELKEASARIAENDLNFQLDYENRDEMGQLCREFDRMREQLAQNNRKMWRMIEDERELRAAIAHDIRSPLSVLKGYQEMLLTWLPDGTIDTQQAVGMLEESMKQISRMDIFHRDHAAGEQPGAEETETRRDHGRTDPGGYPWRAGNSG